MMKTDKIVEMGHPDCSCFGSLPYTRDYCITCGICSSSCPVSGVDGFDPRKVVRMVSFGMREEIVGSRWPWICTMCGKCENACPMDIDIPGIIRKIRSMRDRDHVPGILHKGLDTAIQTGNNLGLPQEDFTFILKDVGAEIAEEPGFENFSVPIDKMDANILTTIHNKLVNTHTDDLKHWWKIFYAAGEDWTVPSINWEGTNWGLFTGDDDRMKIMVGRIVENMERLQAKHLLWPE
ncbi:MAG: 4Fe-4S dicluster domain-containing protein [Desulfobacteraceae bacterium]|nr:MAG: 4Fe-4S dicluster domain-containing protein [Desulfobacteraceae bacterium]